MKYSVLITIDISNIELVSHELLGIGTHITSFLVVHFFVVDVRMTAYILILVGEIVYFALFLGVL